MTLLLAQSYQFNRWGGIQHCVFWLQCMKSLLQQYKMEKWAVHKMDHKEMVRSVFFFLAFDLSVLRGHSVFSSPPQQSMTSDFDGFSIPDFIHYIYFPISILEKEPVFPFSMLSAKQRNYWYHFYNVFGMTQSLTGDWTRDLLHSMPALYHLAIEEAVDA